MFNMRISYRKNKFNNTTEGNIDFTWKSEKCLITSRVYGPDPVCRQADICNLGATENAGVENAIRSKLQGWKMQEWKMWE